MAQRSPGTQFAPIAQGAAGATQLVAAVAGKTIVVKGLVFTMTAGGTAKLRSGAANDITGDMAIAANGGLVMPPVKDEAYCQTLPGEALNIVTTTGLAKGCVIYTVE